MNTKERLKEFLKTIGSSEGKFESSVNLSKGFVSNVGDSIRTKSLEKISKKYPQLNISWLLTGVGKMFITNEGIEYTVSNIDAAEAYAKKDPLHKLKHEEWELVGMYLRDTFASFMAEATGRRLQDCLDDVNGKISKVLQK